MPLRIDESPYFGGNKTIAGTFDVLAGSGVSGFQVDSTPSIRLANGPGGGYAEFARRSSGSFTIANSGQTVILGGPLQMGTTLRYEWAGNTPALFKDAADVLGLRSSGSPTTAQTVRLYNTFTDLSNYERLGLNWASNVITITPEAAGTGTLRGLRVGAASTAVGFLGATPAVQQTSGANLTNNVASGGTTDQIDDFAGTLYSTDAATIKNDIYQLARKLKQVNDALRVYGLLT